MDKTLEAKLETETPDKLEETRYKFTEEQIAKFQEAEKKPKSWGRKVVHAAAAAAIAGYISLAGLPGIKSLEPTTAQAAGRLTSDKVLMQYMNQSCEQTLKGTDVHYVNDRNYQTEVFGSKTPVMVLFYNNHSVNSSQGLTALTRVLHEEFPQVKLCAYKISDTEPTKAVYDHVKSKYSLKKTPSILFYDNDKGHIEKEGSINGGFKQSDIKKIKEEIKDFSNNIIPKYILD